MKINKSNTLCLAMIVKNESKVIERCLNSVKDLIDYWVICDTGSSDGTQDIIKKYFEKENISGELHQHEWRNFEYNRSLCMKAARGKAEYIITLDADEVFKYDTDFTLPKLTQGMYYIWTKSGSFEYKRIQLVSDKYEWCYKGVIHEHIFCENMGHVGYGTISGMYNVPSRDGARSSDPNKYRKDALVFEQALLDDPKNTRYVFYLAQSYRDCYDYENAIKNYKKRTKMEGFVEEKFYAMYELGLCKMRRGEPFENFIGDLLLAHNFRPKRLEPVHKIVRYCRLNKLSYIGYNMFKYLINEPMGTNDILFVERDIYEWKLLDELSLAAYWSGDYKGSFEITDRILKDKKFPKQEEARLMMNLAGSKRKIDEHNFSIKPQIDEKIDRNNVEKVFTNIIDINKWGYNGQKYPISTGYGATEERTREYRALLKKYIRLNNIKSIVDIGCGIWEFYHNEFDDVVYIGIDCVKKVIDFNIERYASKKRIFIYANILDEKNNIPYVDMCIVKDVLQHLNNKSVITMLDKIKDKANYILVINDNCQPIDNQDIPNGNYRALSPKKSPLNRYDGKIIGNFCMKDIFLLGTKQNEFITNENEKYNIEMKIEKKISKTILLAILARNKGHVLPRYLKCIDELDYDKKLITIYIDTNNNVDNTIDILEKWIKDNEDKYAKIEFNNHDSIQLRDTVSNPHAWNANRFMVLGEIRNKSLEKTLEYNCDYYFVIDCDNFIKPYTLKDLINEDKPIIAPLLRAIPEKGDYYSNYFCAVVENGYYKHHENYVKILNGTIKGTFEVPVVHCTYLIKREYLKDLSYIDGTLHHEFVIFSRCAREKNIKQYICNKREYGELVHVRNEYISLEDEKKLLENHFNL